MGALPESVMVAIITSLATCVATIVSVVKSAQVTRLRIERLEDTVKKYNGIKDRVIAVEQSVKSAHHRVDTVERRIEK